MAHPSEDDIGVYKQSTIKVEVLAPQIELETLTNKRIISNGNKIISDLMTNPDYDGITKDSNLIIDIPTPDITQITNYSITSNGNQNIPIPSGYDAVDSINVNVNVPTKLNINRLIFNGTDIQTINLTKVTTDIQVTIPAYRSISYIVDNTDYYQLSYLRNNSSVSRTIWLYGGTVANYYYALGTSDTGSNFMSIYYNNNEIMRVFDPITNDSTADSQFLYKDSFSINLS